jgi:hypothetical protein
MRYDPIRVQEVIVQLSALIDPIALMGIIAKKTKYGRTPGPSPWHYTKQWLAGLGRDEDLYKVINAFEMVGVRDEVDAGVWLAEHEEQIK